MENESLCHTDDALGSTEENMQLAWEIHILQYKSFTNIF